MGKGERDVESLRLIIAQMVNHSLYSRFYLFPHHLHLFKWGRGGREKRKSFSTFDLPFTGRF